MFHLFSCTHKQSTIGFNAYCYHDMPFIYNLLSKILTPKPGECLIFLPKLFPCDWSLAQVPRGAVGSPSLEIFTSCLSMVLESLLEALLLEQGVDNMVSQSSFQPQPLRFSHLVILQLSEIPLYLVFFNWHMQPPDITLRHQGVSKNKQKKMENMKGYKGTAKMTEYSFVKLCNNNNIHL